MIGHRRSGPRPKPLLEGLFSKEEKPPAPAAAWTPIPLPLPGPQLVFDAGVPLPLPAEVERGLSAVRDKERLGNQIEVFSIILGTILFFAATQLLLDYYLKIPWLGRVLFLAGDIFVLRFMWRQGLKKFLDATMSDEEAALKVEKHFAFLEGALIGAVELSQGKPGSTQGSSGLLRALINEAAEKTAGLRMTEAISLSRAYQWSASTLLGLVLVICLLLQTWPVSAILLQRMLLLNPASPFGTGVGEVTSTIVQPEGSSVILSAKADGFVPGTGWIRLIYPDGREEDIPVQAVARDASRFETMIPGVQEPFRYRFFLHDGEGMEYPVKLEAAPVIQSIKREGGETKPAPGEGVSLSGKISWEEGKKLRLAVTASLPLKTATLNLEQGGKLIQLPMEIEGFGRKVARIDLPESYRDADRFFVELTGENNVKSRDHVVYALERVLGPRTLPDVDETRPGNSSLPNLSGMRARDRAALVNLQSEPVPDEYTAMVRQYLRNISEDGSKPVSP